MPEFEIKMSGPKMTVTPNITKLKATTHRANDHKQNERPEDVKVSGKTSKQV